MQIYTPVSVVEPRRLLLSTGKIERLYALLLVSHKQWSPDVTVWEMYGKLLQLVRNNAACVLQYS